MTARKPIVITAGQMQQVGATDTMNFGNYEFPLAIGAEGEALLVPASGAVLEWGTPGGGATVISANTTYYVATTGNDTTGNGESGAPWATLAKAYGELYSKVIAKDIVVTISLDDGNYTQSGQFNLTYPYNKQVIITGANSFPKSFTSVVSASGAAPDRSTILSVNSTANISVNDYALVLATSGGTYTHWLTGMHKITNVDTGNTRITVLNKAKSTSYPSGNITGNFTVLKTMLDFSGGTYNGLVNNGGASPQITKLVVVGKTDTAGIHGVHAVNGGSINCVTPMGVYGFSYGVMAYKGGMVEFAGCGASVCQLGVGAVFGGVVHAYTAVANGCSSYGFIAEKNSYVNATYAAAVGCGGSVAATYGSVTDATAARLIAASTDWAAMSVYNSVVMVVTATISGYGAFYLYPGTPYAYSTTVPSAGSWMVTA